jgi:DNA invertase Pin-like site-specific DNA recombinase
MSTGKTYGYARVSTDGQTLDAQVSALQAAGAERIFSEKQSGAKTDRASLAKALAALESGDVLLFTTRLDRLARSTRDLLNVLATIAERGAGFQSLRDQWADTTTPHGRLMPGGVRTVSDPGQDWRRADPGDGEGGEVRAEAEAFEAPNSRG